MDKFEKITFLKFGFIVSLICVVQFIDSAEINIVVVTDESGELPKAVVPIAGEKVAGGVVKVTVANVVASMSQEEVCAEIFKEVKEPTLVIDATSLPATVQPLSGKVKEVLRKMGAPTVSTSQGRSFWKQMTGDEGEYLIHLPQPADAMVSVIRDLALTSELNLNMKDAVAVYEPSFYVLSTLLQNNAVAFNANPIIGTDTEGVSNSIKSLQTGSASSVFIIGGLATLNLAVAAIQNQKMFKKQFSFFFLTKDDGALDACTDCVNASVLLMQPDVPENGKAAYEAFAANSFPSPQKVDSAFYYDLTLLLGDILTKEVGSNFPEKMTYPECGGELTEEMKTERAKFKLDTSLKNSAYEGSYGKFVFKGNDNNYQEVSMKFRKTFFNESKSTVTDLANWNYGVNNRPISMIGISTLTDFKTWLMLKITTVVQAPFVYEVKDKETGQISYTGYCIELIDAIKEIVGFDYTISEVADKKFGNMRNDGPVITWNGMINELHQKRAEIALGPLSVMAERETVVDFTVPYYDLVGISILMKKPQAQSSLFKFLTVLETNVWGCILGAYFFTSLLMYIFDRLSPYSFHNNREKYKDDEEKRDFNIKECMWFCMTSLTPQGGGEAPRNLSGRLVAATWWLFGFIIIASYTANLAAFLTVSRLDSTIESLDDLSKQYKVKYAPQKNSAAFTYFERMSHIEERFYEIWKNMSLDDTLNETERAKLAVWDYPVSDKYTKIWWTMKETDFPLTFQDGIDKVRGKQNPKDNFAFIADSTQVKYAVMTHCDLVQVGSEFSRKPLALAVQQGSPLKDQLSSAILKLLNQRKLESLKEAWWNKNPYKVVCDDTDKQSDGISIANIGGVFIVIFIGVVLACVTLAIEYWYYKQKKSSTRVVAVKEYGGHK